MKASVVPRISIIAAFIIVISLLHYLTPLHLHYLHDIFQRCYYLPIILAALWFGLKGGLLCSFLVSLLYTPHIVLQWGGEFMADMEKYLEIVLYNIVGAVTGMLAQRERERSKELRKTAEGLEESYSRLRQQSERILAIEEQLRHSEKLSTLGEMAAVLAHEVRNPLGSIRGTAEILKDDYRPDDPKFEFIEIQLRETERLNRVVEDFLNMARRQPVSVSRCSLKHELETIVTLLENDARRREVTLSLDAAGQDAELMADGEKLRQAFLNIILNALQATPGGGAVTIALSHDEPAVCRIAVTDTGSGIQPEILPRIFEPFFTTRPEGTGLGLAITRKIIESCGGSLNIDSTPGKGTSVVVTLPLRQNGNVT